MITIALRTGEVGRRAERAAETLVSAGSEGRAGRKLRGKLRGPVARRAAGRLVCFNS